VDPAKVSILDTKTVVLTEVAIRVEARHPLPDGLEIIGVNPIGPEIRIFHELFG